MKSFQWVAQRFLSMHGPYQANASTLHGAGRPYEPGGAAFTSERVEASGHISVSRGNVSVASVGAVLGALPNPKTCALWKITWARFVLFERAGRFPLRGALAVRPGGVRDGKAAKLMNHDPMAREWLRVVRYFKSKVRERNRSPKRHGRASVSVENSALKDAKGF